MLPSQRILIRPRRLGEGDISEHLWEHRSVPASRAALWPLPLYATYPSQFSQIAILLCSSLPSFSIQVYKRVEVRWE